MAQAPPEPSTDSVILPKTEKEVILFVLEEMKAAGTWHVPTLTRAIEIFSKFEFDR